MYIQVVDSMPRVHAATQYLEEDPELAELCRTDGEGPAELAERIDNISHSMYARKPTVVLAPPRRARQQHTKAASSPSSCVTKRRMRAHSVEKM